MTFLSVCVVKMSQKINPGDLPYMETAKQIPPIDREAFMEDVQEDLHQMDESRIGGLGITPHQLDTWLKHKNDKK